MKYILIYLIIINLITYLLFGIDKSKAKKHKWRISEKTLITFMLLGGFIAGGFAMKRFHHKTQKFKFKFFYILSLLLFIVVSYLIIFK